MLTSAPDFAHWQQSQLKVLEAGLAAAVVPLPSEEGGLVAEAARYSLLGGGKRIRPLLLLATADMLGLAVSRVLPYALAVELIHTYSLIHDDLPALDDDDLRRGRPSCHVRYDEATALLAGDLLLNRAYEILLAAIHEEPLKSSAAAALLLATAAGKDQMIAGQAMDLAWTGRDHRANEETRERLIDLQRKKTGALLEASLLIPARLARARLPIRRALGRFAAALGRSFQIQDDLLDVSETATRLGKTRGKDERDGKLTFVTLLGPEAARRERDRQNAILLEALQELTALTASTEALSGLTRSLLQRDH